MKKILLITLSVCFALGVSTLSFAGDRSCSPGDNNLFCQGDMHLDTGNRGKFCQASNQPGQGAQPNTFKYSAIKGCQYMGQSNCNWNSLAREIKYIVPTIAACKEQESVCMHKCGNNGTCKNDCANVIYPNCTDDTNFFKGNCGIPG